MFRFLVGFLGLPQSSCSWKHLYGDGTWQLLPETSSPTYHEINRKIPQAAAYWSSNLMENYKSPYCCPFSLKLSLPLQSGGNVLCSASLSTAFFLRLRLSPHVSWNPSPSGCQLETYAKNPESYSGSSASSFSQSILPNSWRKTRASSSLLMLPLSPY